MAQHSYDTEYDDGSDWRGDRGGRRGERDHLLFGECNADPQRSRAQVRDESDWRRGADRGPQRDFRSSIDDHYRSWRERHMSELDRDYDEYCREREQQFHSDFAEWRRSKHGNPEPLRTGMTQTGLSSDPSGEFQLNEDQQVRAATGSDPMATATLGNEGGS